MEIKKEARYQSVAAMLEKMIQNGEIKPGEKLPSENELSEKHGLSRQTIRSAIAILEEKGLVDRVRGSGTYVSQRRGYSEGRTTIALILTYVDGYIFPKIVQNMQNTLFEKGYSSQIAFTNNRTDRERVILEEILERDEVAGIIAEATRSGIPNPDIDLYRQIMAKGIKVLFINSFYEELKAPHVSMNDTQAGKRATELLIENGHRHIAGMFKFDDGQGRLRYSGYQKALIENNIPLNDESIIWYDTDDLKNIASLREKIWERTRNCTGMVVYNDEVAYALLPVLKDLGIKVPEDLSICSIDDSELAVRGSVRLCSVPYPLEPLGVKAAENIVEMINNPSFDGTFEYDEPITIRDSVRKI